jgi:hypothetical protein
VTRFAQDSKKPPQAAANGGFSFSAPFWNESVHILARN